MNKKGNQRFQDTRNKIKWVFLNLLAESEPEKITVSEICARAEIHRTTFYGHYEDVNALMKELVEEMYKQVIQFFVSEEGGMHQDGFLKLFEMVRSHRTFFLYYFRHINQMGNAGQMLPEPLLNHMDQMMEMMGYESKEELLYHQTFFCTGLTSVMTRWLLLGCKEEPEEMCRIIEKANLLH